MVAHTHAIAVPITSVLAEKTQSRCLTTSHARTCVNSLRKFRRFGPAKETHSSQMVNVSPTTTSARRMPDFIPAGSVSQLLPIFAIRDRGALHITVITVQSRSAKPRAYNLLTTVLSSTAATVTRSVMSATQCHPCFLQRWPLTSAQWSTRRETEPHRSRRLVNALSNYASREEPARKVDRIGITRAAGGRWDSRLADVRESSTWHARFRVQSE